MSSSSSSCPTTRVMRSRSWDSNDHFVRRPPRTCQVYPHPKGPRQVGTAETEVQWQEEIHRKLIKSAEGLSDQLALLETETKQWRYLTVPFDATVEEKHQLSGQIQDLMSRIDACVSRAQLLQERNKGARSKVSIEDRASTHVKADQLTYVIEKSLNLVLRRCSKAKKTLNICAGKVKLNRVERHREHSKADRERTIERRAARAAKVALRAF